MKPEVRRGFKDIRVLFDIVSNGVPVACALDGGSATAANAA
jgi:hypothetical protein